jgi:hypothetical protein
VHGQVIKCIGKIHWVPFLSYSKAENQKATKFNECHVGFPLIFKSFSLLLICFLPSLLSLHNSMVVSKIVKKVKF